MPDPAGRKDRVGARPGGRPLCAGSGKLTSSTLGRDSAMLKQA